MALKYVLLILLHCQSLGPASAVIRSLACCDLGLESFHLGVTVSSDGGVDGDISTALLDTVTAVLEKFSFVLGIR